MRIIKKITKYVNLIRQFLGEDIWQIDLEVLSRKKAIILRQARVALITTKNFGQNNLGWQSVALSYFTTMSFVPMVALTFTITNGFGLGEYLRTLIYEISTQDALIDKVLEYADNIIKLSRQGPYGLISFGLFIWLIIWLMLCVERAFNKIWKVGSSRQIYRKVISYTVIILLVPFLIIILLSMVLSLSSGARLIRENIPILDNISDLLVWVIVYGFTVLLFTCLNKFIPNTHVKFKHALVSSIITGLAFIIIQYLYIETQYMVSRLNSVYGVFAAVPLFMIWLNTGWTIILTGAQITYAFQSEEKYRLQKARQAKQSEKQFENKKQ